MAIAKEAAGRTQGQLPLQSPKPKKEESRTRASDRSGEEVMKIPLFIQSELWPGKGFGEMCLTQLKVDELFPEHPNPTDVSCGVHESSYQVSTFSKFPPPLSY